METSIAKRTTLNISVPSEILLVLRENENQLSSYMKKYAAMNGSTSP